MFGQKNKKSNPWKRYGVIAMAAILAAGNVPFMNPDYTGAVVYAEEKQEVTLNIAGEAAEEGAEVTEAAEETEERLTLRVAGEDETQAVGEAAEEIEETEADSEVIFDLELPVFNEAQEEVTLETPADTADNRYDAIAGVQAGEGAVITTDVSAVVENCMPSIVSITQISVEEVETFYYGTQTYEAESAASGIIIAQNEEELLVATNSHVVEGATEMTVCFTAEAEDPEELIVPAKLKGMDKTYELAVVAVRLEDIDKDVLGQLKIAALGKSEDLKVGQAAIAIGNALGYGQSVTAGIISALNRELTLDSFSQKVIMTDAAINFGNSGGALLNAKGEVIGINVAKEAGSSVDSMGYSIPIDTAIPVLQKLINKQTRDQMSAAERGYMGATVVDVSVDAKELYNIPEGAFVYEVAEGSAAEKAGIRKGDVITAFDGESVVGSQDLIDKMLYYAVGETVIVEVQTANAGEYVAREVEVVLQKGAADVVEENTQKQQAPQDNGQNTPNPNTVPEEDGSQNEESEQGNNQMPYGYEQFPDGFEDYNNQWNEGFEFFPFGSGDWGF